MCRLAGLLTTAPGEAPPLSLLLSDTAHSLSEQGHSARQMTSGTVNVDGTGVAWWADDAPQPLRYVSDKPPWSDPNLPWLAPRLRAGCQVALVRAATVGIPHGAAFVSPFTYGRIACAHNGSIGKFRSTVARPLLARLPDHLFAAFHGASDSLALMLMVVAHAERDPSAGLLGAVAGALDEAVALAREYDAPSALNLLVGATATGWSRPGAASARRRRRCTSARGAACSRTGSSWPPSSSTTTRGGRPLESGRDRRGRRRRAAPRPGARRRRPLEAPSPPAGAVSRA